MGDSGDGNHTLDSSPSLGPQGGWCCQWEQVAMEAECLAGLGWRSWGHDGRDRGEEGTMVNLGRWHLGGLPTSLSSSLVSAPCSSVSNTLPL